MTAETSVHLRLDSASIYDALRDRIGEWRLSEHEFDSEADEVRVSYDTAGSGRVVVSVSFELDRDGMDQLLRAARPAE